MKRILTLVLAVMMLFCGAAFADDGSITVSGSARVNVDADCVSAVLGVSLSGKDLTALQQQANSTIDAICNALVGAGMDEKNISTNSIYINPYYDSAYSISRGSGEERLQGYTIDNSLTIQTDEIDQLGAYIDAAFAAGANSLNSINFSAKDDSAARKRAMEDAVKDALFKAEIIAAAAGRTLGEVEDITETGVYSYASSSYDGWNYATEAASGASATTVRGAQVSVTANVQIKYELK